MGKYPKEQDAERTGTKGAVFFQTQGTVVATFREK